MKNKKKMKMRHGFMCHSSTAVTAAAVCMPTMANDPARSVILPRKPALYEDSTTLFNSTAKYSRLIHQHHHHHRRSHSPCRFVLPQQHQEPKPRPTNTTSQDVFQVVVMRVSLHCQGCAGKLKKHLSKMEGVTSYSIDLETKRVTVMGHVSPDGVLESISKVKKAEFWPN